MLPQEAIHRGEFHRELLASLIKDGFNNAHPATVISGEYLDLFHPCYHWKPRQFPRRNTYRKDRLILELCLV